MLEKTDYLITLSMLELRQKWQKLWCLKAHRFISRPMLIKSIQFKQIELAGEGLDSDQQSQLNTLINRYRANPSTFDKQVKSLMPGLELVRIWKGKKHFVLVTENGFIFDKTLYSNLSHIAFTITGTKWNGWLFFGLKKKEQE